MEILTKNLFPMKRIYSLKALLFVLVLFVGHEFVKGQSQNNATTDDFGNLIWSDEFDVAGAIDTTKWFHQTRLPNGTSWWNNEIQHYTNRIENSFNDSGYMHIVARKEEFTDQGVTKQYTSARLNSKFAFTYGKVEIRAILPTGVGTWPAMWTLGKNVTETGGYWSIQGFGTTGWPACGEVDIMEHWGTNQDYVQSAMHTPSSSGNTVNKGGRNVPNASTEFHVYRFDWTPEKMVFSIDTIIHYTYNPDVKDANTWPFDKDQYLLLNIAILPAITAEFTESPMILDYVRIYEYLPSTSVPDKGYRQLEIYPNPFENILTIEVDQPASSIVEVFSLSGQLLYNKKLNDTTQQLDLSSLQKGVYLISVKSEYSVTTKKMIKLQ
jgi:beta-glucanase (GH16 family)